MDIKFGSQQDFVLCVAWLVQADYCLPLCVHLCRDCAHTTIEVRLAEVLSGKIFSHGPSGFW